MTYVEFFDKNVIENICSSLKDTPEKILLIGPDRRLMEKYVKRYRRLFNERGYNPEFICKSVSRSNLQDAVSLLEEIVNINNEFIFEISGGENILCVALGIVLERYPDRNIDVRRCSKGDAVLSVKENIQLHGGEPTTYSWNMTPDFCEDVAAIWSICKKNVRKWNGQINTFETITYTGNCNEKCKIYRNIVEDLKKAGLIKKFYRNEKGFVIEYKNSQVRKCLTKAGLALELKIYTEASGLKDANGNLIYNDVMTSVTIDWDGIDEDYDTENEIDVVLMHGMTPVFVSCKNGIVEMDELYKLSMVAERFGGKNAKKALVVNSLSDNDFGRFFINRARDMGITLLVNIQNMSDEELRKKLASLWC
ncbi:MAG: DUF1887 family protein [Ruminococcaceae bacterium]|nr:DUF1887 family protein [Oscillospiraceae bacterium]